eukprot:323858-Rhodomonas_salina.2
MAAVVPLMAAMHPWVLTWMVRGAAHPTDLADKLRTLMSEERNAHYKLSRTCSSKLITISR